MPFTTPKSKNWSVASMHCCLEVAAISHCCLEVAAIFAFVKWPQLSLNYYNYVLKSINTVNILFFFNCNTGTGTGSQSAQKEELLGKMIQDLAWLWTQKRRKRHESDGNDGLSGLGVARGV